MASPRSRGRTTTLISIILAIIWRCCWRRRIWRASRRDPGHESAGPRRRAGREDRTTGPSFTGCSRELAMRCSALLHGMRRPAHRPADGMSASDTSTRTTGPRSSTSCWRRCRRSCSRLSEKEWGSRRRCSATRRAPSAATCHGYIRAAGHDGPRRAETCGSTGGGGDRLPHPRRGPDPAARAVGLRDILPRSRTRHQRTHRDGIRPRPEDAEVAARRAVRLAPGGAGRRRRAPAHRYPHRRRPNRIIDRADERTRPRRRLNP